MVDSKSVRRAHAQCEASFKCAYTHARFHYTIINDISNIKKAVCHAVGGDRVCVSPVQGITFYPTPCA